MTTQTEATQATEVTDAFRIAVDAVVGDDILIDLHRVARLLNISTKAAVRLRLGRGTLPLRPIRCGSADNAEVLVPVADVYALLGLTWTPPVPAHLAATALSHKCRRGTRCNGRPCLEHEGPEHEQE